MKTTLLGLGAFAMDRMIACPDLPAEDSFAVVREERTLPGGSCANMLVTFAALGGVSRMLAKIGDDEPGRTFRSTLKADGVDDSLLLVKRGGVTQHTYVFTTPAGTHSILVNPGDSMMDLSGDDINDSMLTGADVFYCDFFPAQAAAKMAKMCRENGIPVVVCMQCAPSFMHALGISDKDITSLISQADLFISGREGFLELTGHKDYHAGAKAVMERFDPSAGVICTAGSEGAIWMDEKETIMEPALAVRTMDSTGAGDSFTGALLYSYYHLMESKKEALHFAAGAGAMKCTLTGPRMRATEKEVRAFMKSGPEGG